MFGHQRIEPTNDRLNHLPAELPKLEAGIAYLRISSVSAEEVVDACALKPLVLSVFQRQC